MGGIRFDPRSVIALGKSKRRDGRGGVNLRCLLLERWVGFVFGHLKDFSLMFVGGVRRPSLSKL